MSHSNRFYTLLLLFAAGLAAAVSGIVIQSIPAFFAGAFVIACYVIAARSGEPHKNIIPVNHSEDEKEAHALQLKATAAPKESLVQTTSCSASPSESRVVDIEIN